jgi:hypothetical protein
VISGECLLVLAGVQRVGKFVVIVVNLGFGNFFKILPNHPEICLNLHK